MCIQKTARGNEMPTRCELKKQEGKFKKFWEFKAARYPLPFDNNTLITTNRVIDIVKSKGIEIKDKRILDIGCGTGIYTLPLAKEASFVIGLDFTEAMLSKLTDEAAKHKISNVDTVTASWKDFDIDTKGFRKFFDIVWVSMTMAVRDVNDINKMQDCSRRWCVYIGWGDKRDNPLMEEVFALHGLRYAPPPGAKQIYDIVEKSGRKPTIDFIETSWDWIGTLDEAVEDIAGHIEVHGGSADKNDIRKILSCYEKKRMIKHTTHVQEGIITWEVS